MTKTKKGFTIIEVVLVLAIAGLIFLMVFIALPAVQRTQRDAERRDDMGALLSAIQKYQNNNRGSLPTTSSGTTTVTWNSSWNTTKPADGTWASLYYSFLGEDFTDPMGKNYTIRARMCNATAGNPCDGGINDVKDKTFKNNNYQIYISVGASCNDESQVVGSSNPRRVAAMYKMEGGGAYCVNSQ